MKNLLKRLKPEYREMLEENRKIYPSSVSLIIEDLATNYFYTDLKYSVIGMLVSYFNLKDYSPTTIFNLFQECE